MRTRIGSGVIVAVLALASLAIASAFGPSPIAEASVSATPAQVDVALGATVYSSNCSRCHEVDGSGLPGEIPPLLGNPNALDAAHVESAVRDGLNGPIEALGESYDGSMRAFGSDLSDDEILSVVAYVLTLAERDPAGTPSAPVVAEPGNAEVGYGLFIGSRTLSNGGATCAGCHTAGKVGNLGGWSLGPDLTNTVEKFGSEAGVAGWLANPASPTMQPIFGERPLSDAEIADLAAFIADAPSQSKPSDPGDGLVLAGLAGLVVLIGGMAIVWRGMRQTYAERLRSKR